jgi:hypothetical protein
VFIPLPLPRAQAGEHDHDSEQRQHGEREERMRALEGDEQEGGLEGMVLVPERLALFLPFPLSEYRNPNAGC